jgi:hypothetical protein
MKRLSVILLLGLATHIPVFAQGVLGFSINFGSNPPPHALGIPESRAQLSGDVFSTAIYLSGARPSSGRIIEAAGGGTFLPVFGLTNLVFASYPPPAGGAFSYEQSWQLTSSQIQSVASGAWFVEVSYPVTSYLGQFIPVPEPSSLAMFAIGLIGLGAKARGRVRR